MKKLGKWWQWALLAAFAAALVFGAVQAKQVGDHLQYLVPAPAQQTEDNSGEDENSKTAPNQPIADQVKALENAVGEWDTTTMLRWTIGGVIEKTSISGGDISSDTRVELVGKYGFQVRQKLLRYGRLPYEEELKSGRKVAVLDEDLALKLFRVADPLGRKVYINGESYEVIGIARHSKRVGEYQAYTAYIPLNSVIETSTTVDALLVEAIPKPGTGANVSFKSVVTGWQSGGSMFDLGKEGMSATLWLRVLLFLIGMTVLLRFIAFLNGRVKHYGKRYRQRLQEKYAISLMPELTGAVLLFILGYGVSAIFAALLMNYIIQPVYTFPEWIPTVLVEWKDIAKAFWNVWQDTAVMQELRTPEILRLRWLALLVQGCSAGAGVLLGILYGRMRSSRQLVADSVNALYHQGATVSVIHTRKVIDMTDLGYVITLDGEIIPRRAKTVPMVRIINAEAILRQMPAGKRDGAFVLEVVDEQIPANNARWLITCQDGEKTIVEAHRDWDIQLPIAVLTRIVYGTQTFADFLECNAGYDMRMRSPAMDGMFGHHLTIDGGEK